MRTPVKLPGPRPVTMDRRARTGQGSDHRHQRLGMAAPQLAKLARDQRAIVEERDRTGFGRAFDGQNAT
jgi:hypothetical protein